MIDMMNSFNRIASFKRSTSINRKGLNVTSPRGLSVASPRVSRLGGVSRLFQVLVVIGSLVSFLIAIGCGYLYVFPNLSQAFLGYGLSKSNASFSSCNVFNGSWDLDDSYPLYNATECPLVTRIQLLGKWTGR
jgi:hypothetical protein